MEGLGLLEAARAAGLSVSIDGERLMVRGPRSAEALAKRILTHKPEVMAILKDSGSPCHRCGGDPGTTIVVAERTGRIGYGMEIEPKYVAVTLQRLQDMRLEPVVAINDGS